MIKEGPILTLLLKGNEAVLRCTSVSRDTY